MALQPNRSIYSDKIICNPPFGKQLENPEKIPGLYQACAVEWDRVLNNGGRAVLLVSEQEILNDVIRPFGWRATKKMRVRVLGQAAVLSVWEK